MDSPKGLAVRKCEDEWIEVPGKLVNSELDAPVELRPGADDNSVSIKFLGASDPAQVDISALVQGIRAIQEEHTR